MSVDYPPVPVLSVLDVAVDAVLGGSGGYFHVPEGGYLNCDWLSRKHCYRVTIDVTPGHEIEAGAADDFNKETRAKCHALQERFPS